MAIKRYLSLVFAAGVIGALAVMVQPAQVAELWRTASVRAPIADPAPLPCSKQSWPNADRICLTWTAPR